MDIIRECAQNFNSLLNTQYCFHISHKRKISVITLDFKVEDFRHISGLQYLDDIAIESNPVRVIDAILREEITDRVLEKSDKYKSAFSLIGNTGSVQERISELRYLESCIDQSDFIRIYQVQSFGSQIDAEYFIETSNSATKSTVYLFIRRRSESNNYVIVSFFKKHVAFQGISVYWMLKSKKCNGVVSELYRHPEYKG